MTRCPYLIHDPSHLPGLERAQQKKKKKASMVKRMDGQRDMRSANPSSGAFPLKSSVQSYFIQTLTAITVSSQRLCECVISSIFFGAESLTVRE